MKNKEPKYDKIMTTNKKFYYNGRSTINKLSHIVLHHTAGGTFNGIMEYGAKSSAEVSWHYTIGENGEIGKIGNDKDCLWHAGNKTSFQGISNFNFVSIGIEVVSNGYDYNDKQRKSVKTLISYLIEKYNIKEENLIRHADITKDKWDIGPNFYKDFKTWSDYRKKTYYTKMTQKLYKKYQKFDRYKIFNTSKEDYEHFLKNDKENITIGDIKDLIEIGLYRRDINLKNGTLKKRTIREKLNR